MSTEIHNYVLESIPKIVSFIIYLFIIPSIYADILGKGSTVRCYRWSMDGIFGLMKILDGISAYDRIRFYFLMRVLSCIEHLNLDRIGLASGI